MGEFKIFIDIVLYLLLALAFFRKTFKGSAYLLFIFGIIAIFCLTLAEINGFGEGNLGFFFIAPFISFFLFILTRTFYSEILPDREWEGGIKGFIRNLGKIITHLIKWKSMWAIILILVGILCFIVFPPMIALIIVLETMAIFLVLLAIPQKVLPKEKTKMIKKYCQKCGGEIKESCPKCEKRIEKYCSKCGGKRHCQKCGEKIR